MVEENFEIQSFQVLLNDCKRYVIFFTIVEENLEILSFQML